MKRPKRILVGLRFLEQTVELLDIACRLGAHHNSELFLVHILEVPDATPLDAPLPELEARAVKILAAAERLAKRSGMKVSTLVLRARSAGRAIVEESKDRQVDMVVLGSHRRRTLGELFSGTTHQYVAKRAHRVMCCSVFHERRVVRPLLRASIPTRTVKLMAN